jgi:hypothetical protein
VRAAGGAAQSARRSVHDVNVETPEGTDQLARVTGELCALARQVGDRTFVKR